MFGKFVREFTPLEQLQNDLRLVKKQESSQIDGASAAINKSKYFASLKSEVDRFTVSKKEKKIARGFFGTFTSTIWEVDLYVTEENKELHLGTVSFIDFEDKSLDKDDFSDWLWGGFTVSFSTEIVRKMVEEKKPLKELIDSKQVEAFIAQHKVATKTIESCYSDKKQCPEYIEVSGLLKRSLENPKNHELLSFDVDKLLGGKEKDGKEFFLYFLTVVGCALIFAGIITMAIISPADISELAGIGPSLLLTGVLVLITCLCGSSLNSSNFRSSAAQAVQDFIGRAEDLSQEDAEMHQIRHAAKPKDEPQIPAASLGSYQKVLVPEKTENTQEGSLAGTCSPV